MLNVILSGASGRMGQEVAKVINEQNQSFKVCFGVDKSLSLQNQDYVVYPSYKGVVPPENAVIIDFSSPELALECLSFAESRGVPLVLCTTGLTAKIYEKANLASKRIPLFLDSNVSPGITYIKRAVAECAKMLDDSFDIEIIEYHHRKKADCPSGTALDIAKEILAIKPNYKISFRGTDGGERCKKEIGIHSVRGGTITGKHEVMFIGDDEVITFSHSAATKRVFALGALRAAAFVSKMPPGLYNLRSVLGN